MPSRTTSLVRRIGASAACALLAVFTAAHTLPAAAQPREAPAAAPPAAPPTPPAQAAPAPGLPPSSATPTPAAPAGATPPAAVPPRVVRLSPLRLPPLLAATSGSGTGTDLEVFVVVERDGVTRLDDAAIDPALHDAIARALSESQFEPARANGEPVPARVRLRLAIVLVREPPPLAITQPTAAPPTAAPTPAPATEPRQPVTAAPAELDAIAQASMAAPGESDAPAQPSTTPPPETPPAQPSAAPATEPPPASTPAPAASRSMPSFKAATTNPEEEPAPSYGARSRVERPASPTVQHLESKEMRELPGAFGDPFRVLDTLPGVVPALSGLPYVYVRGAPPAGTVYYYDGIQVPELFHLALGPAVVHPALLHGVDFYPSAAPARYGRYTGGVLAGGARPSTPPAAIGGELELRLIDLNGMLEAPLGGGSLRVAGRYGYPGLILSALSPDADLAYWDYQTQLSLPIADHDRIEVTWFGAFDRVGSTNRRLSISTITLEFHRAELRLIHDVGRWELGSALQLGWDRSAFTGGLQVSSARLGPRVYASWRGDAGLRMRFGADLLGNVGNIQAPVDQTNSDVEIVVPAYAADVAARSVMGAYGELSWPFVKDWTLDLGLRSDMWLTGSRNQASVDPRVSVTWRSAPKLEWRAAVGLGHQPAVFLIPLPGIADVGLDHGLQTAVQSEAGVRIGLPGELRLESQLYLQYLTANIFPDLVLDQADACDTLPPQIADVTPRCKNRYPRASAIAYGLEVFLHRDISQRLSGWLSYTLGWADAHADEGFDFTPSFDVRHVLNLVLQYRIAGGFSAGTRLAYRSGKMANVTFLRDGPIRYEQRLPSFFRADVNFAYAWETNWARLRFAVEWLNLTFSREATGIQCNDGVVEPGARGSNSRDPADPLNATPCEVTMAPAIFLPNMGLRADF